MYNCSQRKQCAHKYRRTSIYLRWIYVDTQKLSFRIYIIGLLMTELQQTSFGHNHLPCLLFFNFKWYAITSMSIRPTILALGQYFLVKWLFLFGIDFIAFIFRDFFCLSSRWFEPFVFTILKAPDTRKYDGITCSVFSYQSKHSWNFKHFFRIL